MSDKPYVYQDGDLTVYRASAIFRCLRALVAARLGVRAAPPPEFMQDIFDAGTEAEPVIREYLESQGWHIVLDQYEVDLPIMPGVVIRGHVDGIGHKPEEGLHVAEYKTGSGNVWEEVASYPSILAWMFRCRPAYLGQISTYMYATEMPAVYAVMNRDADPETSDSMFKSEIIDTPPLQLDYLRHRVEKVEELAAAEEYPSCDQRNYPCPYFHIHEEEVEDEERKAEIESDDELALKLMRYGELKEQRDELSDELKDLRNEILEVMGPGDKLRSGKFEGHVVTQNRKHLDKKRLRRDLGEEEFEAYEEIRPNHQLRVRVVDE